MSLILCVFLFTLSSRKTMSRSRFDECLTEKLWFWSEFSNILTETFQKLVVPRSLKNVYTWTFLSNIFITLRRSINRPKSRTWVTWRTQNLSKKVEIPQTQKPQIKFLNSTKIISFQTKIIYIENTGHFDCNKKIWKNDSYVGFGPGKISTFKRLKSTKNKIKILM